MKDVQKIANRFKKDVENFTVNIIHDDGVYRHLSCSNNGSFNQRFEITTYPNYLLISGDMGTNVFNRIYDMFNFFNNKLEDGINTSYWAEKLSIGDGKEFSEEAVIESIETYIDNYCENIEDVFYEGHYKDEYNDCIELEGAFRNEVNDYLMSSDINEYSYYTTIENFESEIITDFEFQEVWDFIESKDYTYRFLWQCHAIVWAIEQYNILKGAEDVK